MYYSKFPLLYEVNRCYFRSLSRYSHSSSSSTEDSYYSVRLENYNYQYIIVRYSGNSYGRLYGRSSYNYLYGSSSSSSSSSSPSKLSTVAIVFIVIGSVIFASVIIGLICYACKRRQDAETITYTNQSAIAISPTPIIAPNNVYTAY